MLPKNKCSPQVRSKSTWEIVTQPFIHERIIITNAENCGPSAGRRGTRGSAVRPCGGARDQERCRGERRNEAAPNGTRGGGINRDEPVQKPKSLGSKPGGFMEVQVQVEVAVIAPFWP